MALEKQGFNILRISLRGWDTEVVDPEDKLERERTKYVLQSGLLGLIVPVIRTFFQHPFKFISTLKLAIKMGLHADRAWPFHLIYFAEACKLLPWLQDFNAKHVHVHFGSNSTEVIMLAHELGGPPYSFTVHGPEEFDKPEFLKLGEKIKRSVFVVAITSYCRSQLYRWADYKDWYKVKVVHCGLEEAFYNVSAPLIPEAPRLVCVGRLCEQKGQLLLIDACRLIADKGIDFELVLAGDGEMRKEIEALIAKYDLQSKVRITGWISSNQVRDEILAARALILPSFAEGLPVVIMEAMALKRPVLTTYVAGIPELVIADDTGWLFPAGDVDGLVTVLEDFLNTSKERLAAMGEAGYKRVLERHSVDVEAGKLAKYFKALPTHDSNK
ncbi:colanic acid biosynthesis glycosyltransferase WcaL [Methyloradius palustris]|uniref:Colanic acid biosynthesis glycosyltransferase WcaL n=1 Tax=Methyloradius palustris TaxID=2778876 RepID=A0A8D5GCV7_9PROT|nr:colanic acid biosynthesis glycosyltransferase WcaL [Methyloradius palustris]